MLFLIGGVGEVAACCLSALSSETMKLPVRGAAGQHAHATVCSTLFGYCRRDSTLSENTGQVEDAAKDTVFTDDVLITDTYVDSFFKVYLMLANILHQLPRMNSCQ